VELGETTSGDVIRARNAPAATCVSSGPHSIGIAVDETTTDGDIETLMSLFRGTNVRDFEDDALDGSSFGIPEALARTSEFLTHPVFNTFHTETEMLRYLRRLESRDLSLTHSMIPLGSCTMKLNATAEMFPDLVAGVREAAPFRARVADDGLSGHVRTARALARGDHGLRGGVAAAECGLAGRIRWLAGDPRVSPRTGERREKDLPDSAIGARDESGERSDGGLQGGAGRHVKGWRHRCG
jgi:hypothetical protein